MSTGLGEGPTIEQITLRVEQVAAQYAIPRRMLRFEIGEEPSDFLLDQLIMRLVRQVVTIPGESEIRVPATWRDGLKEVEAKRSPIMRWWVARHPIRYRTWRAMEVLPNFPELDKYRSEIRLARLVPTYGEA